MAIQREVWADYIQGNLYKDGSVLNLAFNADHNVLAGAVVHLPQAGARPATQRNRSVFPAVPVRRTDTDIVYPLEDFTTDPTHITDVEDIQVSYDKIDSVMRDHMDTLNETIADYLLYKWATSQAGNIVRTTGADVTAHIGTGTRKKFMKEQLKTARFKMNKANIDKADRYAILDSDMLDQLQDDDDLKKRDNSMELDMKNGVIIRLYGFNILERSSVVRYTTGLAAKDPLVANANTDHAAAICWQKNAVERAVGTIKMFENKDDAGYYGDYYSALVMAGGRIRRTLEEGVIAIVQQA